MEYKSYSIPKPSTGLTTTGKKQVVPNQALSLEEIIARFTRGETVNVGRDAQFFDGDEDIEKMSRMDLVDREEYVDKLKQVQKDFQLQEAEKLKKERKRLLDEAKASAAAQAKKEAEQAAKAVKQI